MDFDNGGDYGDLPTRPMRVKVLYSFDPDDKTRCLARFPHTLQIPVVAIDEDSHVGVIGLQQCLQAVTTASPELLSQLSNADFTIYAYDYSEYETPLVGQGLLSAALAAGSGPVAVEKTMITGRVCKNVPAIFSGGVKETLEVKLRLTPVQKAVQTVSRPVEGLRSVSPAMSAGFDPNAWNASRPQTQRPTDYFNFDRGTTTSESELALMDEMLGIGSSSEERGSGQQKMGGMGMAQTLTDPTLSANPAFAHSAPGSRAGSPLMGVDSSTHNDQQRHQSFSGNSHQFSGQYRPASRTSLCSEVQPSRDHRQASTQPVQQQTEVFYNDEGQPRKRAKVMQTDWHGRSSFGAKSGDLRVTAATTHSMQMHRPIPKRPGMPGFDLEPPPRVPTPVPQVNPMLGKPRAPQPAPSRSFLRQASIMSMNSDLMSDADQYSDAIGTSPEDGSADGTPQDIPSSPPVFPALNRTQLSSPMLPTFPGPKFVDSGFMSGGQYGSNVHENYDDDDEDRSPDAQDLEVAAQYRARRQDTLEAAEATPSDMNVELETPGDMDQLPHKMLLNLPTARQNSINQGPKPRRPPLQKALTDAGPFSIGASATDEMIPRPEAVQSRRSSLALPPLHAPTGQAQTQLQVQAPAQAQKPKRKYTRRQRPDGEGSEAGSPAPSDTEGGRLRGPRRSGSGAKRSVIIQQRLQESLNKGEMPQFCTHCGAIETPTWRKMYLKEVDGKPSPLDEAEGEGETIGVEPLEFEGQNGEVSRFLIRKSMKKTKENPPGKNFKEVTVCNPCGLWFNKTRSMRPSNRWGRKSGTRRPKRKQNADGSDLPATDGPEPQSEAFFSEMPGPDDANIDPDLSGENQSTGCGSDGRQSEERQPSDVPLGGARGGADVQRAPNTRPRSNSLQLTRPRSVSNASQRGGALARAVQSSPVRFVGSQESPIEIEEITPKPIRRLLFPSPRREGEVKGLDADIPGCAVVAAPATSTNLQTAASLKAGVVLEGGEVSVFEAFTFDKENLPPGLEVDDELAHLFDGSPTNLFKTPRKTPARAPLSTFRSQRQLNHLLKTPTPSSRKRRKALSPTTNGNIANTASAATNDFMTSPTSSRYFLRSTPSREARTPPRSADRRVNGSAERSNNTVEMTPFSRHIAQMLSDNNTGSANWSSPSQVFDFSEMPAFQDTPGRQRGEVVDWDGIGDVLSSDFTAFEGKS